jgi:hypothetical protein
MGAALDTLFFVTMQPLYDTRPLTPIEQQNLAAFFKQTAQNHPRPGITAEFGLISVAGCALMSVMADEHDLTDKLLERLREDSLNLDVLQVSFGNFPELVQSLKRDLLVHSCLEDFILFPRAGVLEESQCAP